MGKSAFPEALEYFFKSLQIAERYNIKSGMGSAYGNIGIIYDNEKDYNNKSLEVICNRYMVWFVEFEKSQEASDEEDDEGERD